MKTYNYSNYSRELAQEMSKDQKRDVLEKYVYEEDYKAEGDEPFCCSDDLDRELWINETGTEADSMLADVLFGEMETRNGEDYSEYLKRVYFPACDGFGVDNDTTIYCICTVDQYGEVIQRNYTFDGFLPSCELYDDAEDAIHESRAWAEHIAEEEGLSLIPTTTEANGYPKNERLAFVGFEDFEQAERLADVYDLQLAFFERREGSLYAYRRRGWGTPTEMYDLEEIEPEGYEEGSERYVMEYHDDVTTYFIGALS